MFTVCLFQLGLTFLWYQITNIDTHFNCQQRQVAYNVYVYYVYSNLK